MAKVGIRDVAERAGVSLGTVSRVLNDHPSVTAEVRVRVKAVIEALQYRPDPNARGMRGKTSRLIGIVVPDLTNPFFAELLQSVERSAKALGHNVIVMGSGEDPATEAEDIRSLAGRKVDGIILVPAGGEHRIVAPKGLPLILVDRVFPGHPAISADHRAGARVAVDHLIGLGHRRIACIAGPEDSPPARARFQGYRDAMERHLGRAPTPDDPMVARGAFDYESGRIAGAYLLSGSRAERPTAIFASSDQQAIGCLRAATDLGIPVPAGLSVIGFDGIFVANVVTPRLTTIEQPVADIAHAAVSALIGVVPAPEPGERMLFPCRLVERESCAPPARSGHGDGRDARD